MPVIGLDVGSTGCKATLLDELGHPLGYAYEEYTATGATGASGASGTTTLDPELVWEAVRGVLTQVVKATQSANVEAICVSSFGESAVLLDAQDRVLSPAILYTDPRGLEECGQLTQKYGQREIMARTGAFPHPMYSLPKWMWQAAHEPQSVKRTARVMLFGDFIGWRLSGEAVIDRALAARTMALDINTMKWDAELLAEAGLTPEQLSRVEQAGTIVGTLRPKIAAELGLPAKTLLVTGSHDQVCAALGAGVVKTGVAVDGVGTVECLTPAFEAPLPPERAIGAAYSCIPHGIEGMYVTYAFNFTGGALLKWFRDYMAPDWRDRSQLSDVYEELNAEAAKTKPGKLLVLPHFAGAGTPTMDVKAVGAILGWTLNTTRAELYRGLMEGAAYEMRYNLDCLREMGIACDRLHAVGGGAKSDLWMQIKADVMNMAVTTLDVAEAGTMGTALLAWTALGVYRSPEEAARAMIRPKRTFEPGKDMERYAEEYAKYRRMPGHIKAIAEG